MNAITQSQVNKLIARFFTAQDDLVIGFHSLGLDVPEVQRPYVIRYVCEKTGATFNESASGKLMLDSSHAKYNTAKCMLRDVMLNLAGETRRGAASAKQEPKDAVTTAIKAYMKLTPAQRKAFAKVAGI